MFEFQNAASPAWPCPFCYILDASLHIWGRGWGNFLLEFCEKSISWQKLSEKCDSVAQRNDFFVKMKRRMSQEELQRAAWRAPGGHECDWGNRKYPNFRGLGGP